MISVKHKNKGITPIVSTLLLLLVVIVLITMAMAFFTRTFESVSRTTGGQSEESLRQIGEDFRIDSIDLNRIYIRNTGTSEVRNLKFYVNNSLVSTLSGSATSVAVGDVKCFAISSSTLVGTVIIKVSGTVKSKEVEQVYSGSPSFYTNCP